MKDESLNKNPHLGFLNNIDWMNAQASEIFISVNDRNHPELPVLSASQEWGMIYRDEGGMNIFHDVANEITYKRVRPGQFVIHLRSFQGGFAHSKVEGITSPAYTILDFKDKNKHNDLFWKYVLTSEEFIKRLELITYGIRDGRSINFSDFSTLNFYFPSYGVQLKVGTFLSHVDSLIQARTKKLESLKAVKKSLLQKCFPKAGEKVPEMRFAEFSGDWEEKKLGEIANIYDGTHQTPKYQSTGVKFLSVENIKNLETDKYISTADFVKDFKIYPQKGDILMTRIGDIGTTNIYLSTEPIAFYVSLALLKPTNIDSLFLNYVIQSPFVQNELSLHTLHTAIPKKINKNEISLVKLLVPSSKSEQQKIGQFFSKYDSLISVQQKEIDKLKNIKKSLLQKMFV